MLHSVEGQLEQILRQSAGIQPCFLCALKGDKRPIVRGHNGLKTITNNNESPVKTCFNDILQKSCLVLPDIDATFLAKN